MPLLSKPAFGPRTSIIYITLGSLIDVWTVVYYFCFAHDEHGNVSRTTWFWLIGLFLTGLTLIVIGVLIGEIGRNARKAELPPPEAQTQEAAIQETAAAVPHQMMPGTMAGAPMMTAPMMGAMPAAVPMQPAMPAQPSPMVPGSRS